MNENNSIDKIDMDEKNITWMKIPNYDEISQH
jgi:hypothetical protein